MKNAKKEGREIVGTKTETDIGTETVIVTVETEGEIGMMMIKGIDRALDWSLDGLILIFG